jgi:hypothetical protein
LLQLSGRSHYVPLLNPEFRRKLAEDEAAPTMNALGLSLAPVKLIEVTLWAADLRELSCRIRVVGFYGHRGILS